MKFNINSRILERLLAKVLPVVPNKTPQPILEYFYLVIKENKLLVYATDNEIAIKATSYINAEEEFEGVVPAKLLYDIVKSLGDEDVRFEATQDFKLKLKTDSGQYFLTYLTNVEYPVLTAPSKETKMTFSANELKRAFDLTTYAVSKEPARPAMTGELIELSEDGVKFVATDGHRLIRYLYKAHETEPVQQYIIPEKAVHIMSKLLEDGEVSLYPDETVLGVEIENVEMITKLIGHKYPDYNSVIPLDNEKMMKINKHKLLTSIRRMLYFGGVNFHQVKFTIYEDTLEVSADDAEKGHRGIDRIPCEFSGETMEIAFNTSYLADVLTHLEGDDIIFKINLPTKAIIILPSQQQAKEELLTLIMPVRLNNG
ncbi:MAG: DNA polymerase III subunit beta [Ignavibacteriaceae bacterium]|nr:DNA polymerase III subunit beta [Ignavibacteriaceae bacterium]